MNTRRAVESDASHILTVIQSGISENIGGQYSTDQINGWLSGFSESRIQQTVQETHALVVEIDGAIVGFGNLISGDSGKCEIDLLYVAPQHHRQGVGKRLVEELELEAMRRHCRTISADVSLSARGLFLQLGYSIRKSYIKTHQNIEFPNMWVEKNFT
jgi:GNAT superfamily N-acetyltransferase